jgi:hypothetical protein
MNSMMSAKEQRRKLQETSPPMQNDPEEVEKRGRFSNKIQEIFNTS